jgi:hypothetical protein
MSLAKFSFLTLVIFSIGVQADIFSAKEGWKDQNNKTLFLQQFHNKWIVASIAYTSTRRKTRRLQSSFF